MKLDECEASTTGLKLYHLIIQGFIQLRFFSSLEKIRNRINIFLFKHLYFVKKYIADNLSALF
jgi:hypothetical protein